MKRYNNNSQNIRDWNSRKLNSEARALDRLIYVEDCFGVRDLVLLNLIYRELERREGNKKQIWEM